MTHAVPEDAIAMVLTDEERHLAYKNGWNIWHFNRVENNTPMVEAHASVVYKETGPVFETKSQAAEIAVARHLGHPEAYLGFSREKKDFQKPDLLGLVEVRRVLDPNNPLRVFEKDAKAHAIVVKTFYVDNTVYIIGWEWADKAWLRGMPSRGARLRYKLEPAETLKPTVLGLVGDAA